jgi:hypothetical protein
MFNRIIMIEIYCMILLCFILNVLLCMILSPYYFANVRNDFVMKEIIVNKW